MTSRFINVQIVVREWGPLPACRFLDPLAVPVARLGPGLLFLLRNFSGNPSLSFLWFLVYCHYFKDIRVENIIFHKVNISKLINNENNSSYL